MKVVKKSKMPDGTHIQIEDWKDVYDFMNIYSIATYPKAKNSSKYGFIENNQIELLPTFKLKSPVPVTVALASSLTA